MQHVTLMDDRVVSIYFGKQNQSFKRNWGVWGLKFHSKKWLKKIRQTAGVDPRRFQSTALILC